MKFDLEKINIKAINPRFSIKYIVYTENEKFNQTRTFESLEQDIKSKKIVGNSTGIGGSVCFATLNGMLKDNSTHLLLKVNFKYKNDKSVHLTEKELKKWVNLCIHHKLMPYYIGNHFLDTGNFIVKLNSLTMSRLYVILLSARYTQEFPEVVRATIYLRKLGLNFFLALQAATKCTVTQEGHSIFKEIKQYCVTPDPHTDKVAPIKALALKTYLNKGCKSDDISFSDLIKQNKKGNMKFKVQKILNEVEKELNWEEGKSHTEIPKLFSERIQERLRQKL